MTQEFKQRVYVVLKVLGYFCQGDMIFITSVCFPDNEAVSK